MYIRFVITANDPVSGRRQGLFQAMGDLNDRNELPADEVALYEEHYEWFCRNLRRPRRLSKSTRPHAKKVALSWFKDTALEHLRRMHAIVDILRRHGVPTEMIQTDKPGYIVYEDRFQIAAEPFKDTGA